MVGRGRRESEEEDDEEEDDDEDDEEEEGAYLDCGCHSSTTHIFFSLLIPRTAQCGLK